METAVLIAGLAAAMAFGFFLVKQLDAFLVSGGRPIQSGPCAGGNVLRIAFSDPSVAGAISGELERLAGTYPELELRLYTADVDGIRRALGESTVEVAFFSKPTEADRGAGYGQIMLPLAERGHVTAEPGGLAMSSLSGEPLEQYIVWKRNSSRGAADALVSSLKANLGIRGGSASGNVIS